MDVQAALADIDHVCQQSEERGQGLANFERAVTLVMACILRNSPAESIYAQRAREILKARRVESPLEPLTGTLMALRGDIDAGALKTFQERIHADVYSDLLSQADGLHRDGYSRAAAVIAGAALEEHIRKLASKAGIDLVKENGRPKEASTLNADLRKAEVYKEATRAQVESWQKLRNDAAHGQPGFEDPDKSHVGSVEPMILGIRNFIVQFPA